LGGRPDAEDDGGGAGLFVADPLGTGLTLAGALGTAGTDDTGLSDVEAGEEAGGGPAGIG
jgi:hypothetical protein